MARKTKDALGLAAPPGEPGRRPLQPDEALPGRLAQLADDLDCRCLHRRKFAPLTNPVECANATCSKAGRKTGTVSPAIRRGALFLWSNGNAGDHPGAIRGFLS